MKIRWQLQVRQSRVYQNGSASAEMPHEYAKLEQYVVPKRRPPFAPAFDNILELGDRHGEVRLSYGVLQSFERVEPPAQKTPFVQTVASTSCCRPD